MIVSKKTFNSKGNFQKNFTVNLKYTKINDLNCVFGKMFKIPSLPDVSEKVNKNETLKEFSMKDIEKGEVLGGGSFGTTFNAKFNGKEVALKQLHPRNDEVPKFLKEAKIMSCLMHENIVGFEAVCYHPLMFMMELVVFDFNVFGTDKNLTARAITSLL